MRQCDTVFQATKDPPFASFINSSFLNNIILKLTGTELFDSNYEIS
jgi:hypothetical protein